MKKIIVFGIAVPALAVVAAAGWAQEANGPRFSREEVPAEVYDMLETIVGITNDSVRLSLYDEFARSYFGFEVGESFRERYAHWQVSADRDPISDEAIVVFFTRSETGGRGYLDPPALIIRQTGSRTEAYVNFRDYFSDDDRMVTYRIDQDRPVTSPWILSTDNTALFVGQNALGFVNTLLDAGTLVVRATPYNESPVTATFNLRGLREIAGDHAADLPGWELSE